MVGSNTTSGFRKPAFEQVIAIVSSPHLIQTGLDHLRKISPSMQASTCDNELKQSQLTPMTTKASRIAAPHKSSMRRGYDTGDSRFTYRKNTTISLPSQILTRNHSALRFLRQVADTGQTK